MTFNPNTDTNWSQVVTALNGLSAEAAQYFLIELLQYLANDVTNATTINAAEWTNGITAAKNSAVRAGQRTF